MTLLVLAVVLAICILVFASSWGLRITLAVMLLVSASLAPFFLTGTGQGGHVGIAPAQPALSTYGAVALGGALLLVVFYRRPSGSAVWFPLLGYLVLAAAFAWQHQPIMWSGFIEMLLAPAAWLLGAHAGSLTRADERRERLVVKVAGAVLLVQLAVVAAQAAGLPVNPMGAAQARLLEGRYNGTFDHPNELGRAVFLLLLLVAPSVASATRRVRRAALLCASTAIGIIALTGGRANLFGALASVVLWVLLGRTSRRAAAHKVVALWGSGIAVLVGYYLLLERFRSDPGGGARAHLAEVATRQIALHPWFGTGPNTYVEEAGRLDALTRSGVPVHNTLMLAAAELGIVGAALLLLPLVVAVLRALRRLRASVRWGPRARVLVASLPGLAMLGATGWSLLATSVLPLLFFVVGFLEPVPGIERRGGLTPNRPHAETDHVVLTARSSRWRGDL